MVMQEADESYFHFLMKSLNKLRKNNILYDVRIVYGSQEVPAHKCILVASSDYFKSLFLGPVKTDEDKVDLSSVALDFASVEAVIDFLYTGKINIDDENLEAILKLSTYLLLTEIQNHCEVYMKRSTILKSYLNYYLLSIEYMLPEDYQDTLAKTVGSRFHDFFIFEESTKAISPFHLKHLMENYNTFENSFIPDILPFVTDWVLNGKTEEHELLGTEILEIIETRPKNNQLAHEVHQTIEEIRETLGHNRACPKFVEKLNVVIDKYLTVNMADIQADETTTDMEKLDGNKETSENPKKQMIEVDVEQVVIAFVPKKRSKDFFLNEAREISSEADEGIFDLCVYVPGRNTWYYLAEGPNDSVFKSIGSKVESVGTHTISFDSRLIQRESDLNWSVNSFTLDKICIVSPHEATLHMYHLQQRVWESVSYKHLVTNYSNFNKTNDVRLCCKDGEILYLILRKTVSQEDTDEDTDDMQEDTDETEISFTCYKLGTTTSWSFLFETPCINDSDDDFGLYKSKFDVCLSQDGKEMFIVNEGESINMFVANLEAPASELKQFLLSENMNDTQGDTEIDHIWLLQNKGRVFVVDEQFNGKDDNMYYRSMLVNEFKDPDQSEDDLYNEFFVDVPCPDDGKRHPLSKHFRRTCDHKSVWVFLRDGKFETSLDEMVLDHDGCMELVHHTPPPFSTLTIMAAGTVRSQHLAHLKRLKKFLQE